MTDSAEPWLPERPSLRSLRESVQDCRGCGLYRRATQAVMGEGLRRSRVVLVGEQPGDREDREGRPFVGPAGRFLDRALEEAGIDRSEAYVTNVVKHFKWKARGKRRIHEKPSANEVRACRPWFEAELEVVKPDVVVALGATAAKALYGGDFRVSQERGRVFEERWASACTATVHPSAVLRAPDDRRSDERRSFVRDLRVVRRALAKHR